MAAVHPLSGAQTMPLRIGFRRESVADALARRDTLAVVGFGLDTHSIDPRHLVIPLAPLGDSPVPVEVWQVDGDVQHGRDGDLAWSEGGGYLMVCLRLQETEHGGPAGTAEHAYRRLLACLREHGYPHLLRAWNYLAEINLGDGDRERYRHFSIGRADGIAGLPDWAYPAATAIGRVDGHAELLVFALAARSPGQPIENPRQVSAYRYPRQYGPVPPSFARAMRMSTDPATLLISGTASVIGHDTAHLGDPAAQAAETLRNLDTLVQTAGLGTQIEASGACLKAYLRHPADLPVLEAALQARGIGREQVVFLHGDICRSDLLLEIDGSFVAG